MTDHVSAAPVESRIDLPADVDGVFDVYINGIHQQYSTDYQLDGRTLIFARSLVPEVKMTPLQWLLVAVGIGNYGKYDTVDVTYEKDGRRLVVTGLKPRRATNDAE